MGLIRLALGALVACSFCYTPAFAGLRDTSDGCQQSLVRFADGSCKTPTYYPGGVQPKPSDPWCRYNPTYLTCIGTSQAQPVTEKRKTAPQQAEEILINLLNGTAIVLAAVFSLIALFIVWFVITGRQMKQKQREHWRALPPEGPMEIHIEEYHAPREQMNSKNLPCGLKIDVRISQNDWRALANGGLMKYVLFESDGLSGARYDPHNTRPFHIGDLKTPTFVSFWDVTRMYAAKELLIDKLQYVRAVIEQMREGERSESFEI